MRRAGSAASSGGAAVASGSPTGSSSKRRPTDPQGPVLELLSAFGVKDRNTFYDTRIRGKLVRYDNIKTSGQASSSKVPRQVCVGRPAGGFKEGKDQWRGFKYDDFEPLRALWKAYIEDMKLGDGNDLFQALGWADLHGSTLEVVSAQNPGCTGVRGTVIEETQRTFRLITRQDKVKVLPKERCIFELEMESGQRIRLLGPAWKHRLPGAAPGPFTPSGWMLK